MNPDTIFPVLNNGERIIRRFTTNALTGNIKFMAILTSHRLLTRTKRTVCCCCHHSSYSAISLESIHRIDEHRANTNRVLYSVLWIFWLLAAIAGISVSIFFAPNENTKIIGIVVSAIPLLIMSITVCSCLFCCFKRKSIELNGTFGSLQFFLEKTQARLFESNISEQIFQSKLRLQQSSIPITTPPTYYLYNETVGMDQQTVTSSRF